MFKYIKAFRKYLRNSKYLVKEEILFKDHSILMTSNRLVNYGKDKENKTNDEGLKILIVSKFFTRNFGDRLGFHNITLLLSSLENIAFIDYDDLEKLSKDPSQYDLLIIGTGNSLYHKMINDEFYQYLSKANKLIGIFGFQYYEKLLEKEKLFIKCIDLFDKIFLRYNQDVKFLRKTYSRNKIEIKNNIIHLGDWLILLFPNTLWFKDEKLNILPKEPFIRNAMDLYIQDIQMYRIIHSSRLHTLLCAFCSAEKVSYEEQYEKESGYKSGKFRGLLIDIFDKNFEEKELFFVDRKSVNIYRKKVSDNFDELKIYLKLLLEDKK